MTSEVLTIGLVWKELAKMLWPSHKPLLKSAAFWYAGPKFLALAVCRRTRDEPVLSACSMISDLSLNEDRLFCAGVLELTLDVGAESMPHVVGLASEFCRIGTAEEDEEGVPVSGMEGRAFADIEAVARIEELFSAAGLRLVAIDCEDCALMTLAENLGVSFADACATDPLAAVSLVSSCEARAAEYGVRLGVPIGLALARLAPRCRRA